MHRAYAPLKRDVGYHRSLHATLIVVLSFMIFVFVSFFMRSSFNDQREELIEKLREERNISRINEKLKVELAGITQGRHMELKARERLGLKKAKDNEVLVLRHE
jgi:hypothetical protein